MSTVYIKGDLGKYTDKKEFLHGAWFYEVEMIEGHLIGQLKWTMREPK